MKLSLVLGVAAAVSLTAPADARPQWSKAEAQRWYGTQPWSVGSNYTPATAINKLEMWQPETWDPATSRRSGFTKYSALMVRRTARPRWT